MRTLIVYAHPEPTSFTGAMKDRAAVVLRAAGHEVEISDLHDEGFNPVAGRHDFTTVADTKRFHYQTEQDHAAKAGGFAPDLAREQARLMRADLLIFLFPIWWGGLPAILKGWFDRVLAYGVAYADGKRYEQGYFVGRRGVIGVTTGGTQERFSATGVYGEMDDVLYPVRRCMLEYLGLEVPEPFVAYAAPRVDQAAREAYLAAWETRVCAIAGDKDWLTRLQAAERTAAANRSSAAAGAAWTR